MNTLPEPVDGSYILPDQRRQMMALIADQSIVNPGLSCMDFAPYIRAILAGTFLAKHGWHVCLQAGSVDWQFPTDKGSSGHVGGCCSPMFLSAEEAQQCMVDDCHVWVIASAYPTTDHMIAEIVDPTISHCISYGLARLHDLTGHRAVARVPSVFCWSLSDHDPETFERVTGATSALYVPCPHRTAFIQRHARAMSRAAAEVSGQNEIGDCWPEPAIADELWDKPLGSLQDRPSCLGEAYWIQVPDGDLNKHSAVNPESRVIPDIPTKSQ